MSNFSKWQSRGVKYMQINDAKNPCQIRKKTGSLKCKGWFEDVQQGEWSALKQLNCFLNGHLTTSCRPCNHPLGRALTKSRVCKREIQQPPSGTVYWFWRKTRLYTVQFISLNFNCLCCLYLLQNHYQCQYQHQDWIFQSFFFVFLMVMSTEEFPVMTSEQSKVSEVTHRPLGTLKIFKRKVNYSLFTQRAVREQLNRRRNVNPLQRGLDRDKEGLVGPKP